MSGAASGAVYVLCAATSAACALLLLRGYRRTGMRLLLWSGLCFIGLALDNITLFLDIVVFPDVDFSSFLLIDTSTFRRLVAFMGVALLLYGLIWDSR
jgi:hypothetical protein